MEILPSKSQSRKRQWMSRELWHAAIVLGEICTEFKEAERHLARTGGCEEGIKVLKKQGIEKIRVQYARAQGILSVS